MLRILALLVESNEPLFEVLRNSLRDRQRPIDFIRADTLKDAVSILRERRGWIEIVILDLSLPDSQGKNTFYKLQRQFPDVLIAVIAKDIGDADRIDLAQNGAIDCLVRNGVFDSDRLYERIVESVDSNKPTSDNLQVRHETDIRELLRGELDTILSPMSKRIERIERTDRYMKAAKVIGATVAAAVAATMGLLHFFR